MSQKEQSTKLKILSLQVKNEEESWILKAKSMNGFTEARPLYSASVVVDNEHFDKQVESVKKEIAKIESQPDLFDDAKSEVNRLKSEIKDIEVERKECEKLEVKNFTATVEVVDFSKSTIAMRIPEESLLEIVKIREQFSKFEMIFS